ncbi:DNA polymerase I [Candidatus Magnetoovum chiemensis]|nr:DNA polymerase I [Candidatus Magnetoovum chiemensis]
MRRIAKTINFGIIYGMSAHGLSDTLKIPFKEAKNYIDKFFQTRAGLSQYIEKTIEETKQRGFSITLLGRTRPIADLDASNKNKQMQAQRLAVNSPIQGSCADIIKIAMIKIHNKIKNRNKEIKMILQVHDELLFEVSKDCINEALDLIKTEMENAVPLKVPLKVDICFGKNWAEITK